MPLDELPGKIVTLTRNEIVRRYLRDYQFRLPDADVGTNSLPSADAATFADQQMLLMHDAEVAGRASNVRSLRGERLLAYAKAKGIAPLPATGATGHVVITAAVGGTTIYAGDELVDDVTSLRFKCLVTALYANEEAVSIIGIDTGPSTNLDAGTKLQWVNPRLGCAPLCVVFEEATGDGLTGGHEAEQEEELIARIEQEQANPRSSGNTAAIIAAVQETPGVPVEKAFAIPAILGHGTIAVCFTVRPTPSGSRAPNDVQRALVEARLVGLFPADDGIFVITLIEVPVDVALVATWAKNVATWADVMPWPEAVVGDLVEVDGAVTPTATTFRLTTGTNTTTPQVGQTIGFYDAKARTFRAKRIGAVVVVVANRSWTITVDTSNGASDTSYSPKVGQRPSPWSTSLALLLTPVRSYLAKLGPGELVASFPDPGLRQRRSPEPPAWPHTISNRLLTPIHALSVIADADVLEPAIPYATPVGTPGVLANLLIPGDIAVFEQ